MKEVKQAVKHFGREEDRPNKLCLIGRDDERLLEKLCYIPKTLDLSKKNRVTIDYDPDFPKVLIQYFES